LTTTKDEAERQIALQIQEGGALLEPPIQSEEGLERAKALFRQWDDYNRTMLRRLFDTTEVADEYVGYGGFVSLASLPWQKEIRFHRDDIQSKIDRLESITRKLNLYEQPSPPRLPELGPSLWRDIFVVHGHDEAGKQAVARFIDDLQHRAIILHEQASAGRTIIEKFEDHSDVAYAVVLLTPDDVCAPATEPQQTQPRARQNVIFELGFFVGKLGRERVCVLYKKGVEIPSDYQGVIFVEMDDAEGWKLKVGKEMQEAGLSVDLNLIR
jgi:predicted nucleotide-binding protein